MHDAYQKLLLGDLKSASKFEEDIDNQIVLHRLASDGVRGRRRLYVDALAQKDSGSNSEGDHSNDNKVLAQKLAREKQNDDTL